MSVDAAPPGTDGMLHDYLFEGVTPIDHPPAHLLAVEHELNQPPHMVE